VRLFCVHVCSVRILIFRGALHFLFDEREKIEATGHSRMMDPDLIKTHEFICDQIQGLHRKIFEDEYQQFSERLAEVFDYSSEATKRDEQ
jgi:hypothetical protein